MDPSEADADLVGRTSARLLASGVDRADRLAALHLLAILDASIDMTGRVRRPLDDLAAEFELAPISVLRSLDHLEHAGAVQRVGGTVILLGSSPDGLGGMQLADFIDDVRASFANETPARRSPWLARSGAALVAAAAAFAVFTLAPVTQPATQSVASSGSTITSVVSEPSIEIPVATVDDATAEPTTIASAVTAPDGGIVAASTCPSGSPVATVVNGLIEIANPTGDDLTITEMSIGGTVLHQVIDVAAGETVQRDLGPLAALEPSIDSWEWSSEDVARTCPS